MNSLKRVTLLLPVIVTLFLALSEPVHAFYDPQRGRWLNRDPIEEPPLAALTRTEIIQGDALPSHAFGADLTPDPVCRVRTTSFIMSRLILPTCWA